MTNTKGTILGHTCKGHREGNNLNTLQNRGDQLQNLLSNKEGAQTESSADSANAKLNKDLLFNLSIAIG